jgi:molecular chaperone DnaK
VLVDITPHTMGIKCVDQGFDADFFSGAFPFRFAPIIRRGTPLPTTRSEMFATMVDNQPAVEIDVFQGESDDIRRNHRVGMFKVEGLARVPAGNQIVVQLDLTLDGILKVSAREKATGLQKAITIENALTRLSGGELAQASERLERLWQGSFDQEGNEDLDDESFDAELGDSEDLAAPLLDPGPREGQREAVQARALLEKAERLRDKATTDDQAELDRLMSDLRAAVTDRRWPEAHAASNQLADVLFYLEDA